MLQPCCALYSWRGLQVGATCRLMTPVCCAALLTQQRIGKLFSAFPCELALHAVSTERECCCSQFHSLVCTSCTASIGRVYQQMPVALQELQGLFILDTDQIFRCVLWSRRGPSQFDWTHNWHPASCCSYTVSTSTLQAPAAACAGAGGVTRNLPLLRPEPELNRAAEGQLDVVEVRDGQQGSHQAASPQDLQERIEELEATMIKVHCRHMFWKRPPPDV